MTSDYQKERAEQAAERAERLRSKAGETFAREHEILDRIPVGQPILVGHHSQRRHERDIERSNSLARQGLDLLDQAKTAERAAVRAEQVISSQDPEAIALLEAKLVELRADVEFTKLVNKAFRKGGLEAARLVEGITPQFIERLEDVVRFFPWKKSPCSTEGINAEIRRVEARIVELRREQSTPEAPPLEGDGWRIEESKADARIRLFFTGRPSRDAAHELKANGFKWAPSVGAWQRQLNDNGRWAARKVIRRLFGVEVSS